MKISSKGGFAGDYPASWLWAPLGSPHEAAKPSFNSFCKVRKEVGGLPHLRGKNIPQNGGNDREDISLDIEFCRNRLKLM